MSEPSFLLSYWRPWNEDASFVDSWGDYLRNTELVEYGVDKIGKKIQRAAQDQIYAVQQAAMMQVFANKKIAEVQIQAIQKAATMIGSQLQGVNKGLDFLNRRMDIVIEQQRVGLLLQNNIAQLLKIPDSEKERQQAITLGIQFFENASKDPDLFDDALEEFLKAEQMKKQDYFVLHKIGCIHLYTKKHMDVSKAMDYFLRAGKYASVESSPSAIRLANILTNSVNDHYIKQTSDPKNIKQLAGDSYNKAALAAYILGDDEKSIEYQKKALSLSSTPENRFTLGKYLMRRGKISEGIKQLDMAVTKNPDILYAILNDVDTAGKQKVIQLVESKAEEINLAIEESLERMLYEKSYYKPFVSQLFEGQKYSYPERVKLVETVKIKSKKK